MNREVSCGKGNGSDLRCKGAGLPAQKPRQLKSALNKTAVVSIFIWEIVLMVFNREPQNRINLRASLT